MSPEFIMEYLELVIVGICLCFGYIIKNIIPSEKINKYIPLIMGFLGVIIAVWINATITPQILLQGLASGLASTGMYEAFHNLIHKK